MAMESIKSNKILYLLAKNIKKILVSLLSQIRQLKKPPLRNNLKKYKNIHQGKRCFIVATGPSLTLEDLKCISNEYTISMNSIINLYEKTSFRPTYYMIQDGNVERKLRKKLINNYGTMSFMGIGDYPECAAVINKKQAKVYKDFFEFYNLKISYHIYDMYYKSPQNIRTFFSEDCAECVYDGCTVTYSAIQLACYMGFKEIYLLGCDTNFSGHVDDSSKRGNSSHEPALAMIRAYEEAKKYADNHDIKIYNATRGGMLEVFPRVNFDDLF